jgi:hypothetical protein
MNLQPGLHLLGMGGVVRSEKVEQLEFELS